MLSTGPTRPFGADILAAGSARCFPGRRSPGDRRIGAEDGARTRDLNLGKVALYQLSYFRKGSHDMHAAYVPHTKVRRGMTIIAVPAPITTTPWNRTLPDPSPNPTARRTRSTRMPARR